MAVMINELRAQGAFDDLLGIEDPTAGLDQQGIPPEMMAQIDPAGVQAPAPQIDPSITQPVAAQPVQQQQIQPQVAPAAEPQAQGIGQGFSQAMLARAAFSEEPNEQVAPIHNIPNTLVPQLPEGLTPIGEQDFPNAVQIAAGAFPSMSETGILVDPQDRMMYSMAVMSNKEMRSDLKAKHVDQVMRDGRFALEALPNAWYAARNLNLTPIDPTQGGAG